MLEVENESIWTYDPTGCMSKCNKLICIPTNGYYNQKTHNLTMGAGLALEAVKKYPYLKKIFGEYVYENGNIPCIINDYSIASFPTKDVYWNNSSLSLIERSAIILRDLSLEKWDYVLLPRVGCGLGKLKWKNVREVLSKILVESMFIVVNNGG